MKPTIIKTAFYLAFIAVVLMADTSCKKDISASAHLFPIGARVVFYNISVPEAVLPMRVTGIFNGAEKRAPNFYYVTDARGVEYKNVADYQLRDY